MAHRTGGRRCTAPPPSTTYANTAHIRLPVIESSEPVLPPDHARSALDRTPFNRVNPQCMIEGHYSFQIVANDRIPALKLYEAGELSKVRSRTFGADCR
jgi:hypothetical protein